MHILRFLIEYRFLYVYKLQEDTLSRERDKWTQESGSQVVVNENISSVHPRHWKENQEIQW